MYIYVYDVYEIIFVIIISTAGGVTDLSSLPPPAKVWDGDSDTQEECS